MRNVRFSESFHSALISNSNRARIDVSFSTFSKFRETAIIASGFNIEGKTYYKESTMDVCFSKITIRQCVFANSTGTAGVRGGALCVGLNCGERPEAVIIGTVFVGCVTEECGAMFLRCRQTTVNSTCFTSCLAGVSDQAFQCFAEGMYPHSLDEISVLKCGKKNNKKIDKNVMSVAASVHDNPGFTVQRLNMSSSRESKGAAFSIRYVPVADLTYIRFDNIIAHHLLSFERTDECNVRFMSTTYTQTQKSAFNNTGRTSLQLTIEDSFFKRCNFASSGITDPNPDAPEFNVTFINCFYDKQLDTCDNLKWVDIGAVIEECNITTGGEDPLETLTISAQYQCLHYTEPPTPDTNDYTVIIALSVSVIAIAILGAGAIVMFVWRQRKRSEYQDWMDNNFALKQGANVE